MPDNPTPLTWFQELYRQSPTLALLIGIIVTGFLQYWVWGSNYREMRNERDEYRKLAFDQLHAMEANAEAARQRWQQRSAQPLPTPVVDPSPLRSKLQELEQKKSP